MFNNIILLTLILGIDYIYLSLISSKYNQVVNTIQNSPLKLNYYKALGAYIFMFIGLKYLIINQINKKNKNNLVHLLKAFILGLTIYGTYNFTNGAIFKDFNYKIMLIDTLWGSFLYTIITFIYTKILNLI